MSLKFECGQVSERDIHQINLLDVMHYDEKYLLSFQDYKERLEKNKNIIYTVKNSTGVLIGYCSIVPLDYESYIRIKNGEVDKEVITIDSIIAEGDEVNNVYIDSIIVNPYYRKYGIGKRLMKFAMTDLYRKNKKLKYIVAHTISNGGEALARKNELKKKKRLDENTVVYEKVIIKKQKKKVIYKSNDKRLKREKHRGINNYL